MREGDAFLYGFANFANTCISEMDHRCDPSFHERWGRVRERSARGEEGLMGRFTPRAAVGVAEKNALDRADNCSAISLFYDRRTFPKPISSQ